MDKLCHGCSFQTLKNCAIVDGRKGNWKKAHFSSSLSQDHNNVTYIETKHKSIWYRFSVKLVNWQGLYSLIIEVFVAKD